jgi:hypothetical protein
VVYSVIPREAKANHMLKTYVPPGSPMHLLTSCCILV